MNTTTKNLLGLLLLWIMLDPQQPAQSTKKAPSFRMKARSIERVSPIRSRPLVIDIDVPPIKAQAAPWQLLRSRPFAHETRRAMRIWLLPAMEKPTAKK